MRALACLGDKTTYGEVISATATWFEGNKAIAQTGDLARCNKCQGAFPIFGTAYDWSEQQPYVATGDKVLCRCPDHVVYGSATQYTAVAANSMPATTQAPSVNAPGTAPISFTPSSSAPPSSAAENPANNSLLEEEEEEEEVEDNGIVLRLGLFFDGTGNNQANSAAAAGCFAPDVGLTPEAAEEIHQHCLALGYDGTGNTPDNSYGNNHSNVARLHELYPDDSLIQLAPEAKEAYIKVYLEGIGTSSGLGDSLYSQGTGEGLTGVVARVEQMPALVMDQLRSFITGNPNLRIRRIEIDLFGFSRGAAAARHCANDLLKGPNSLLAQSLPSGSPLLAAEFAWRHRSDFALNFIGLFDTVAGIVSPGRLDFSPHNANNPGLHLRLAPGIARKVVHLVARDEHRHNFSLTQAEQDIELPGCHSDIGGGYLPLVREKLLLSKPDSSEEIDLLANERSAAFSRTKLRFNKEARHWLTYVPPEGLDIATWSVRTQHRQRDTQAEKRVYAAITGEREVRGELSLVYLRIMRELATRAGVVFKSVPSTPASALPTELQSIAAKLQVFALHEAFTPLTPEENALLYRRYIHLSAHWNAARNLNNSALSIMFINRPAEHMQRKEHPNE